MPEHSSLDDDHDVPGPGYFLSPLWRGGVGGVRPTLTHSTLATDPVGGGV